MKFGMFFTKNVILKIPNWGLLSIKINWKMQKTEMTSTIRHYRVIPLTLSSIIKLFCRKDFPKDIISLASINN